MRYIFFLLIFPMLGCATYMENKIGQDFKSIQPDFTNVMQGNKALEGAAYDGRGGLFASDVRANNVGDIITVTLEESMTAAGMALKQQLKKTVTLLTLPEALFGPFFFDRKNFYFLTV